MARVSTIGHSHSNPPIHLSITFETENPPISLNRAREIGKGLKVGKDSRLEL